MHPDRVGDWKVESALGRGGMGTVFRAHASNDADHRVAIKVCDAAWNPEALARFRREATLLQEVEHRGVVRIFDACLDAKPPYLVMELVDGEELGHLVTRLGALPVRGALLIATALAEVLAHLHARAIYHRDVKPANVIVLPDRSVKLVDFGIAREEGKARLTMTDNRVGTAAYSPPEWVQPENTRPQLWDLYALGVILDEMLTGRERFPMPPGITSIAYAVMVMTEKSRIDFLDPGPEIPEPLRQLVRELTSRDASKRPATAREVHHRLKELLRQPHVAASPGLSGRALPGAFEDPDDSWLASEEDEEPQPVSPGIGRFGTRRLVAFSATVLLLSMVAFCFASFVAVVVAWSVVG